MASTHDSSADISRRAALIVGGATVVSAGFAFAGPASPAAAAVPFALANPFTQFLMTDDWKTHLARDSQGGIDYSMSKGTPLPAAAAGIVEHFDSHDGRGWVTRLHLPGGWKSEYLHVAEFVGASGRSVGMGEIVAKSGGRIGDPGAGTSTGAHLHWHLVDPSGARANPLDNINASFSSQPAAPRKDDDDMKLLSNLDENGQVYLFGEFTWQMITDPNEATNLSWIYNGSGSAPKVYGGQINWMKNRVNNNRAKLVADLAAAP